MNSHEGILKEIIANPDDDAPRLVYADWLEEQGDPDRAEFVRIQLQMAIHESWQPEHAKLESQIASLLTKHEESWKKELGVKAHLYYRRGTIEQLTLTAKALCKIDTDIFKTTPIKRVRITRLNAENLAKLLKSGIFKVIPGLRLNGQMSVDQMIEIVQSCTAKLKHLDFSGYIYSLDHKMAAAIGDCPLSKRLRTLSLRACDVSPDFFEALAARGGLPKLECLELGGGMVIALPSHFENMNLKHVKFLRVGGKQRVIDVEELCHVSPKKLKTVYLKGTRPPMAGLKRMIEVGIFKNVERIEFTNCNLSKKSMALLLDSKFSKCTHLDLTNNPFVDQTFVDRLASGKSFPKLKAVNVRATKLDGAPQSRFKHLPFSVIPN